MKWVAALLIVFGVLLIPFQPPDFKAHGCEFVYMGGDGYPFPFPLENLKGYAMLLGGGITTTVHWNSMTGEIGVECVSDG